MTAATQRMGKLYAQLTNRERVALSMAAIARQDGAELQRIRASAPVHTYRMPDAEYVEGVDRLTFIAAVWSVEYHRCLLAVALALLRHDATESGEREWRKVKALWQVLEAVCARHGVALADMLAFAGAPSELDLAAIEPDAAYQRKWEDALVGPPVA